MKTTGENGLNELKSLIKSCLILHSKNRDYWQEYCVRINDSEWIENEGLKLMLSEEMLDLFLQKNEHFIEDKINQLFDRFISSFTVACPSVQCSLAQLCISMAQTPMEVGQSVEKDRIICWVVRKMLQESVDQSFVGWSESVCHSVTTYLVKLLFQGDDIELALEIITILEKVCLVKTRLNQDIMSALLCALHRYSSQLECFSQILFPTEGDNKSTQSDWLRYQAAWCARWCEDNLLSVEKCPEEIPCMKLSPDRFEARCESLYRCWIRSPFAVQPKGVYFYEVSLLTEGRMELGWSTREGESIWLEVDDTPSNIYSSEGTSQYIFPTNHPVKPGDTAGLLIDVPNRLFAFYLNGEPVDHHKEVHFSTEPYFATAVLYQGQQCRYNFGQAPFRHPPPSGVKFRTFHKESDQNVLKYRLMEPVRQDDFAHLPYSYCWFKYPTIDNQVALFYVDKAQSDFNDLVRQVGDDIANHREIRQRRVRRNVLPIEAGEEWQCIRYIQAIIELMSIRDNRWGEVDKVDVMAQWVGQTVEDTVDVARKDKLIELLYPYLHLHVQNRDTDIAKHRAICAVLLRLIKCERHYGYENITYIQTEVFSYLARIITSAEDKWTQLLALNALQDLKMSDTQQKAIKERVEMINFENVSNEPDVFCSIRSNDFGRSQLSYQLNFCSNYLLDQVLSTRSNPQPGNSISITTLQSSTLSPTDHTPHLHLSPCLFFARSDLQWQSVRSACSVSSVNIVYYEVGLLTSGAIPLGWATQRTDLSKIEEIWLDSAATKPLILAYDEYAVMFDGYNRCIYHDRKRFQLRNIPRCKAGDIVGCLIDISRKSFHFYLNGSRINFQPFLVPFFVRRPLSFFFSDQPYYALISLSPHQQCYCNFGQLPFHYPPKRIDFHDFTSMQKVQQQLEQQLNRKANVNMNFQNANLENVIISAASNVQIGNISMPRNHNHTSDSVKSIGHLSSVQIITAVEVDPESYLMSQYSNIPNSSLQNSFICQICQQTGSTKLFRFVCCDHLKFCINCATVLKDCQRCKARCNREEKCK